MVGRKYTELTLIRYTGTNKPLPMARSTDGRARQIQYQPIARKPGHKYSPRHE